MDANNKYYQQAQQQYTPTYNLKVDALKNQLLSNQQNLEQQKTGINNNYDLQVQNQNLNNKLNKNNVSNTLLGRGLSNSSIAISGLAEQDAKNTRLVGDINRNRTADLNNIDEQKNLLAQNFNNTLAQMEADKLDAIMSLAYQLEDRDWDKNFKNKQLQQEYALAEMQKQYQYAQLALQREQMNSSNAWKQKEFDYKQQLYNQELEREAYNNYRNTINDLIANPNIDSDDKYKALHQVYMSMYNDNKKYGYDYSDLQKNITDWGNRNPLSTSVQGYLRNREKTQSSSSSSSSKGIGTQDFYSLSSRF